MSKTSSQKPHARMPFTPSGRRAKSRRRSACRSKVLATPRAAPCTTTANTRTGSAATRATAVQRHYSHFHRRSPHYHCYCWIGLTWIGLDLAGLPNWLGWAGLDWTGLGQFWSTVLESYHFNIILVSTALTSLTPLSATRVHMHYTCVGTASGGGQSFPIFICALPCPVLTPPSPDGMVPTGLGPGTRSQH